MAHGLDNGIVEAVGKDQNSHAGTIGEALPANLLVQAVFDSQISVVSGDPGQPSLSYRLIPRR